MRKFLTFISIALLFITFAPKQLEAQVFTEIDSTEICHKASVTMPVVVQNMNGIDSLRLVLSFNSNIIEFVEVFAINTALSSGGTFNTISENDSIILKWKRNNTLPPATIIHDTLFKIKFKGINEGSTLLKWNGSTSFYYSSGNAVTTVFIDGMVVVRPKINVLLTEIDPTCYSKCDANYMANASGGIAPYTYRWNGKPGRFDSIQTNICAGLHLISIADSRGCILDSTFTVRGLPGANVKLIIEGNEDTTIYLQNPVLTFSFQEVYPTHVVEPPVWEFGDGDTAVSFNPTHVYTRANSVTGPNPHYELKLHIINENGCDSLIVVSIPIKDAKLKIPGVITPNSDGKNDSFMIVNLDKHGTGEETKITNEFQRMELVIFDRWGRKIYDDANYKSDWQAKGVPDGSYYFKLKTVGFYNTENYKGSITILGSGNTN